MIITQIDPIGEEDQLLLRFAQGDMAAADELIAMLSPKALAFGTRMLGDREEAEDVVQEAMLRLWRIAPEWEPGRAKPSTWLLKVISNLCVDRHRKSRRMSVGIDGMPEQADDTPSVEATMIAGQRRSALDEALLSLSDRQRQAVILRHIEGLANPEIASIMETSIEAVESLTARGKAALARVLRPQKQELM